MEGGGSEVKHSQKAKLILITCMVIVGLFSIYSVYKSMRPTRGLPYERLTFEQAEEYMEFEGEFYVLVDVGTKEEYASGHMKGAINIPYDNLVEESVTALPDIGEQIYLYGRDEVTCDKAARKLRELGYNNIASLGNLQSRRGEPLTEEMTETTG